MNLMCALSYLRDEVHSIGVDLGGLPAEHDAGAFAEHAHVGADAERLTHLIQQRQRLVPELLVRQDVHRRCG